MQATINPTQNISGGDNAAKIDNLIKQILAKASKLVEIYNPFINDPDIHKLLLKYIDPIKLQQITTIVGSDPEKFKKLQSATIQLAQQTDSLLFFSGLNALLQDLINNNGILQIKTCEPTAFTMGANIAATPGKIIYQNQLMQLIQYLPSTKTVYHKPILFIPPWINKYYILDISREKSMVSWLINAGFTVFMISWINPSARLAQKSWEDYLLEGPIAAVTTICRTLKCKSVHMVGYCIGGTLLACTLAYMRKLGDNRAASASYFTTMLDFSAPGAIGTFVDHSQVAVLNKITEARGVLAGSVVCLFFQLLRPEHVWPYLLDRYLLKKTFPAFDLTYWNEDNCNIPHKMLAFYLQNMYLQNNLTVPNKIVINNVPIDLTTITTPAIFIAAEKDHIAPWQSVYSSALLHGGKVTFVLSAPGHVVGIINPPKHKKYSFKINPSMHTTASAWQEHAETKSGSWWPFWHRWLLSHGNSRFPAIKRSIDPATILEDAPGSYAKLKLESSFNHHLFVPVASHVE